MEFRILSRGEITERLDEILARSRLVHDAVAAEADPTFANSIGALAEDAAELDTQTPSFTFPAHVSPDKAVRDAAVAATKALKMHMIEIGVRDDVYRTLVRYRAKGETLDAESQRLLDKTIEAYERNGLALPDSQRKHLLAIQKRIAALCVDFQSNLSEDKTVLHLTEEELAGMPSDFLARLPRDGEKFVVTVKLSDALPILKQAHLAETRRRIDHARNSQCMAVNGRILEDLSQLRHEAARLLGADSHADHVLAIRMARSRANVAKFLAELRAKLEPFGRAELEELTALKAAKGGADEPFRSWDYMYYLRILLEEKYEVDEDAIKAYFPMDEVLGAMLRLYETLFGLRFVRNSTLPVWHEDVAAYSALEAESGDCLGYFYMDLHPRDGKLSHAAAFPLQPACERPAGRQVPVAALVTNFAKSSAGAPALLRHGEVVTLFHEFGHVIHTLCSRVRYSLFSGTSVEGDFAEAPSQMLEQWCWNEEVLGMISGHVTDRAQKLPTDLIRKMIASKNAGTGLTNLRQVCMSMFDLELHSRPVTDTARLWNGLRHEVALIDAAEGTNQAAIFMHMAGGYDAQYYGYLYSEAFASDMFERFEREGVLSAALGQEYRSTILSRGGAVDSLASLTEFLGRGPSQDAFLRHLGLAV
jgi:thimet oligopeptidase